MTGGMHRIRPPYLHRYHTRHGKFYWYVRKPGGKRIRIKAEFGTPEFDAAYNAAIEGQPVTQGKPSTGNGTLAWLWERYRETGAWTSLRASTRRQRENIMAKVLAKSGNERAAAIRPGDVLAGRDARATKPSQAKGFLVCMRAMYRWAVVAGHVRLDPTVGIKNLHKSKTEGFPVWNDADVEKYHGQWPLGTRERVWLDVLLYTGLRRGDAVTVGRQHVRDGLITLRTEKTGEIVTIPILGALARTLAAGPTGDLSFICGASGKPLTKESFGNMFRVACNVAGVFKKSAHGVRKIVATTAADNGATEKELEAIFGWQGGGMAALYTRSADRKRAGIRAGALMERNPIVPTLDMAVPTLKTPKQKQ